MTLEVLKTEHLGSWLSCDPTGSAVVPGARPSSSEEMAKRGISMMAEQQRLRTVRGGLESLSVWDDSDTDRRFRKLCV